MTEPRSVSTGATSQMRVRRVEVAGRRLVAKSATGRRRSELRREAELLDHLQHRHVIDLTVLRESDDRTDMITDDAGDHTLSDTAALCPEFFFAALTATAEAVAELHEAGWSHGALCAEHVVVDDVGGVTLCSLGTASMHGADDTAATDDLLQLRAVIDAGLRHHDDDWSHAERGRWRRLSRRARRRIDERRSCSNGETLTARALTESLRTVGAPSSPPTPAPRRVRSPVRLTRTPATLVTAAAAVGVAALLWATTSSPAGVASAQPSPEPSGISQPPEPSEPTDPPQPTEPTQPGEPPQPGVEEVSVTGNDVRTGSVTFRAGTDGDRLAVVDPDCTGTARVMLLRPSTGEVFEFSEWATTGRPARARLHSVHPGAVDLEAIDTRTGDADVACPEFVLRYSAATTTTTTATAEETP